jgi:phenylacetate-CoA ligase
LERNIDDLRIPIAITNGETLQQHQRKIIEQAFHCEVFDQYGCAELSVFAAEEKCHRMHVSVDYGITEIVDDSDRPAMPGESGHLVCTGLINDAQILLRCRVGDIGAWSNDPLSSDPCECGSVLPVLRSLDGRSSNAIILSDGRAVFRVGTIAEEMASVSQYQIVQEEIGKFAVYVVASAGFTDLDRDELIRNLAQHVGRANIRVELVNSLKRDPGGKFAFIVSKVPRFPNRISQSSG